MLKNRVVPDAFQIPAGDQAVEEDKVASTPEDTILGANYDKFVQLVNEVMGNYMEERVCEREVLVNYAKYSEEQVKYKCTPTYKGAASKFAADRERCAKDVAKYKGMLAAFATV